MNAVPVFATANGTHVVVPWRQDLASLVPHAREMTHQGQRMLVLPNQPDEAKLCRNLGVPVPSPIFSRYGWPGNRPAWDIQKITAAMMAENKRAYVLNTMGTGKTRSAIFACDYLMQQGLVKKVLIAAPLSTLTLVWLTEIFGVLPHRKAKILHGTKEQRLKRLAEPADFYIINHHGLITIQKALLAAGFDAVVVDEFAIFRNKSTDLWKACASVVRAAKYAWGMTGSPTPNNPTDAWAQMHMLTPDHTTRTFGQFQDWTMRKLSQFKWIARPDANENIFRSMQPSVRFTRDDVMELPPTTYVDRSVELDGEAKRAYKMLFDKMKAQASDGRPITAANEGVLQTKLMQVACGYIYTDNHTVYELPNKNRLDALEEVIAECDRKILVFLPFVHALTGVAAHLRKKGHSVATVHGSTPRHARDTIFTNFRTQTDPRIIVAHPQTMAHGLTLTEANTVIWYAPIQSLEIYEQANARVTRPGQDSKTLIVHLSGTNVERMTYARLRSRAKMQGLLLAMFNDQTLEF